MPRGGKAGTFEKKYGLPREVKGGKRVAQEKQDRGVVTAEEKLAYVVEACHNVLKWIGRCTRHPETTDSSGLLSDIAIELKATIHRVTEPRLVMFMQQTVTTEDGELIPCIAVEGERGYHKTDWKWGKDFDSAERLCEARNAEQGIGKIEALRIVAGTMR